jgi:hypothetical protein
MAKASEVPYFPNQTRHKCGHFYPDVLRLYDSPGVDGGVTRHYDCVECGHITEEKPDIRTGKEPPAYAKTTAIMHAFRKSERARLRALK